MEEKKTIRDANTLWSFFGFWNYLGSFFRRADRPNNISFGFTIIELLIVIGVIGALAAGIITVLNPITQLKKAHDAIRKSDLLQIQKALELYYNDNNKYPSTPRFTWYSSETGDPNGQNGPGNNGNWIPGLVPTYIQSLPRDPVGGPGDAALRPDCASLNKRAYLYGSNIDGTGDGQSYVLMTICSMIPGSWNSSYGLYDPRRTTFAWKVCAGQGCPNSNDPLGW